METVDGLRIGMASRLEKEKAKAYDKAVKKSRARSARQAARAAESRKHQTVIRYAADGQRIGDDGYLMTPARKRLHTLYNAFFFLMIAAFVGAAACMISSYFQNQTITEWELVWVGGNLYNGFSIGTLLRIEALLLLYLTIIFLFSNQKGMAWMYDGKPKRPVQRFIKLLIIPSAMYFLVAVFVVGFPDPVSLAGVILGVLEMRFVEAVDAERDKLEKVPVDHVVVKE